MSKPGWAQAAFVVAVVVGSLVVGCAKTERERSASSSTTVPAAKAPTTTTRPGEDFVAEAHHFVSLKSMTPVRGFFISNQSGYLDEALAVANSDSGGTYPVGTIIQLVPQEAMVKRRAGFDPGSNDWEFFELNISATGTEIHQRGGAEIVNRFGSGSCSSCHAAAGTKFDFVCEETHGCEPLPFGRDVIDQLQEADVRPVT